MSRRLYYSTRVAGFSDNRPADWTTGGPHLKIGSVTSYAEKYVETDDADGLFGHYDYWEISIDQVTFLRPADFDSSTYTITGSTETIIEKTWDYIDVDDTFVIPGQFDTTGLYGPFRIAPSGGTLEAKAFGVNLAAVDQNGQVTHPGISGLIDTLKSNVKESFWTLTDHFLGTGIATAIKNVDVVRQAVFDIQTNAVNVLQFGMEHFNDPNIASYYSAQTGALLVQSQERLQTAFRDLTLFPGDPALEKIVDDAFSQMRTIMSIANGTRTNLGNVTVGLSLEVGPVTITGTTGVDIIIDGAQATTINGGTGPDLIFAGAGNDTIITDRGGGADYISAGSGNDRVVVKFPTVAGVINANSADVEWAVKFGDFSAIGIDADSFFDPQNTNLANAGYSDGGTGNDTFDLSGSDSTSFTADLESGFVNFAFGLYNFSYTAINFENIVTGGGDDVVFGTSGANNISTSFGNDVVLGLGGDDTIDVASGWDIVDGGTGNDRITGTGGLAFGGSGDDSIAFSGTNYTSLARLSPIANDSFATAMPLDTNFRQMSDTKIDNSVTQMASQIRVTGSGADEYYMISVLKPGIVVFDIDEVSDIRLDTILTLYDANLTQIGANDNSDIDPGSTETSPGSGVSYDSFLRFNFAAPGTYYLKIESFATAGIPPGWSFTLNVSQAVPITSQPSWINTAAYGGDGNDTLFAGSSLTGQLLNGGLGFDVATFENAASAVTASLASATATNMTPSGPTVNYLVDIEGLVGSAFNDILTGDTASNYIGGGAGNDTITGGGGADSVVGGDGNDRLVIATGANGSGIDGGSGTDTLAISGVVDFLGDLAGIEAIEFAGGAKLTLSGFQFTNGLAGATILSGNGTLTIDMEPTDLELYATSLSVAAGSSITFLVNGASSDEIVKGVRDATNVIYGNDGNDQLRGGALRDFLFGGVGNDKLLGGLGSDILTGGAGADQFRFQNIASSGIGAAADQIIDFQIGADLLVFRAIDPDAVTPGDQAFAFIGSAAFGATGAAQMRYMNSGANLLVQADVNGDGIADMEIVLAGLAGQTLTGASFLL